MKISKLFHWLYAILMLLPFAFFVPSVLYYAFNDNATMQTVEVPKTETIAVDFNQKLNLTDNSYTSAGVTCVTNGISVSLNGTATTSYNFVPTRLSVERNHIYLISNFPVSMPISNSGVRSFQLFGANILTVGIEENQTTNYSTGMAVNDGLVDVRFRVENGNSYDLSFNAQIYDLTQMFGSGNEPTPTNFFSLFPYSYNYVESELMQITYDTGETEQLVQNTDIVNYAWESIWDLPLFSWSKVSFVATPFTFITGLFGLASSNSFNYVFTYFASMSIIWLVFDVVLYVPLLVHRWLDKGIVE